MFWGCSGDVLEMCGRCVEGVWKVFVMFWRCLGGVQVCLGVVWGMFFVVLDRFGLFQACLGSGSGGIGYKSVGMGRLVESGTDLAFESTGLRGKSR